jgi:hypothetical protein
MKDYMWEALSLHMPASTRIITATPHTLRMLGMSGFCYFDRETERTRMDEGIAGYAMGCTFVEDPSLKHFQFCYRTGLGPTTVVGVLDCSTDTKSLEDCRFSACAYNT